MITCRELDQFLLDYVSGELPADQRSEVDRHLAACPPCVRYLEQYRATIAMGKLAFECPDDGVPAEVPPELLDAIIAATRRPPG